MPAPLPGDLSDQADHLLGYRRPQPPTQADLRRAVSAAYYGVFHLICNDMADLFAGVSQRKNPGHHLIYRSLDHGQLRKICIAVQAPRVDVNTIAMLSPPGRFMKELIEFAAITTELQEARHRADYDPGMIYTVDDARGRVQSARDAVNLYETVRLKRPAVNRFVFLSLLAFKKRL